MTRWSTPLASTQSKSLLVEALARAFVEAWPHEDATVARAAELLGREWRWLRPVAQRYVQRFAGPAAPRRRAVAEFLLADAAFKRAWEKRDLRIVQFVREQAEMRARAPWAVPPLPTVAALAAWFNLTPSELDWFADLKGLLAKRADPRLRHYSYRAIPKRSGRMRLIEAPKQHLRAIQRRILHEILAHIPAHAAVHGFVQGCSIRTFAAPHVNRAAVLRMDLADFFPSFTRARVQALFRMAGYPEAVADRLGGLCTTGTPQAIWKELALHSQGAQDASHLYGQPHLPQGAPTSPALANLLSYRLDARLSGLARAAGAVYTRYADDLAFSGNEDFARRAERLVTSAAAIAQEEGFAVNFRKTRLMRQGVRQHLAGLVTNHHVNVPRADYDSLKATLTNCLRHGPEGQNRDGHRDFRAHLQGRVSFIESVNPQRGARLRQIFNRIAWPSRE